MLLLENLTHAFVEPDGTPLPVLDIERFEMAAAEQVALIGPSGCGKTTLLHVIAGIRRPDGGRVVLDDTDLTTLSEARRDRFRAVHIGYIFQTFNLLPGFTALENVLLGMAFADGGADRQRASDLLDRVGLAARADHKPGALSVGEQQRVAVARALANRPRLLLADEPTANVDLANQRQVVELICDSCRAEQVALLLVTHATEVAQRLDRTVPLAEVNRVGAACDAQD